MLEAVLYARFHPERGPSIIHQYPERAAIAGVNTDQQALCHWNEVSPYVIPPYEFCNRSLSICNNGHRVIGFPISIEDTKYERNRFTFNVCYILPEDEDPQPWIAIVKKTARFFKSLEEEDGLLQTEETLSGLNWAGDSEYPAKGVGIVYNTLKQIADSLNTYGETCVRLDAFHVLNLRLETTRPLPPEVQPWEVPLLTRPLPDPSLGPHDLTLQRIRPHLDGVKHVQKIAELADVEPRLVQQAVRDLIHHHRCTLLDIFHFQATYACTPTIAAFIASRPAQAECRQYVHIPPDSTAATAPVTPIPSRPTSSAQPFPPPPPLPPATPLVPPTPPPSTDTLIDLYTALQPGQTVADFCMTHAASLRGIDVRRLITFGVLKGFVRRVHRFPVRGGAAATTMPPEPTTSLLPAAAAASTSALHPSTTSAHAVKEKAKSNEQALQEFDEAWRKAVLSSGWATPPAEPPAGILAGGSGSLRSEDEVRAERDDRLRGYLDGRHCLDQICVEMHLSETAIAERLRSGRFDEVVYLNR